MDGVSLLLSYVMPIGYTANDLRNLLLKGSAAGVEGHIAILLLTGGMFFAAESCREFPWRSAIWKIRR